MIKTQFFSKRIGAVNIPEAEHVLREPERGFTQDPFSPEFQIPPEIRPPIEWPPRWPPFKICTTNLREGCYTLSFRPNTSWIFGPRYRGTLRVEHIDGGHRISGDLYVRWLIIWPVPGPFEVARAELRRPELRAELASDDAADTDGVIPVYPRRDYYSYLKGTGAQLFAITPQGNECWFRLDFDEFRYEHPAAGFSGTFPAVPNRSIRFVLNHTDTPDFYSGRAYEGSTELGTVSIRWVSPYFRRASMEIHTLDGADAPQAVADGGTLEDFHTVFATAGWDLNANYAGTITLPASLVGVQDPKECWSRANSATLMESVPGYDPTELDNVWKARLLAIPARLGCSRGRMFDNGSGDLNDVPREGAVTHSHDGYPGTDTCGSDYGVAEDDLQRDHPRAFLRSAAHEVGHTFNQIHQQFEGGVDNSIMTVTPCVSGVIAAAGGAFPGDINLEFNSTVRRHLIHLPDPAVRPGAMEFFGTAVNAPEADQVAWLPQLSLKVTADADAVRLGEPLSLTWELANEGSDAVPVPSQVDVESLTVRVSVTDPSGKVTFMRPFNQEVCTHISIENLEPDNSISGSTDVYWGRDGFAFETPGRHTVDVVVLWDIDGLHFGTYGQAEVWVEYPATRGDNEVAALLLDPDVGRAVASGDAALWGQAAKRISDALKVQEKHPACVRLRKLGLAK